MLIGKMSDLSCSRVSFKIFTSVKPKACSSTHYRKKVIQGPRGNDESFESFSSLCPCHVSVIPGTSHLEQGKLERRSCLCPDNPFLFNSLIFEKRSTWRMAWT